MAYTLVDELIKRSRHDYNYTKIFATSNVRNCELLEELGFEMIGERKPVNMVMDLGELAYCSEII
ncbi:MAG: hypothetical protein U9R08_03405 [Nanoarchaeota archaeon]|nr:hypothetical protein [Nanoarchaeota archaeon]